MQWLIMKKSDLSTYLREDRTLEKGIVRVVGDGKEKV